MMESITTGRRGSQVLLWNNTAHAGFLMSWQRGDEFARLMRYKARGIHGPEPEMVDKNVQIRREGGEIIVEWQGRLFAVMPLAVALEVGNALVAQVRLVEEHERAEAIIFDQALLLRKGMPFGLTDNPDIQAEAGKEAAWNTTLRRAIPGGVRGREQFGKPRLRRMPCPTTNP